MLDDFTNLARIFGSQEQRTIIALVVQGISLVLIVRLSLANKRRKAKLRDFEKQRSAKPDRILEKLSDQQLSIRRQMDQGSTGVDQYRHCLELAQEMVLNDRELHGYSTWLHNQHLYSMDGQAAETGEVALVTGSLSAVAIVFTLLALLPS